MPASCNWCTLEEETGLKGRLPMLRLVDTPLEISNAPAGGYWAYSVAGLIIAQQRWLLWKANRSSVDRMAEACIFEELHNYACNRSPDKLRPGEEVPKHMGDMALFAQRMRGMVIGSNRYGGGVKVLQSGLVQTAWAERYGYDAPHPSCAAFTHFLKQWLFNYGPLFATIDGSALHLYTGGILTHPSGDSSAEPATRNCGVLVVGYCDSHWICRADLGVGNTFGEGGFFRVAYGALGINDSMQFMVVRLVEQ